MITLFATMFSTNLLSSIDANENTRFSYVCYEQNGNVMLSMFDKTNPSKNIETIDIGISTNCLEKITMDIQNNYIRIAATYTTDEVIHSYFDKNTLEFSQVNVMDSEILLAHAGSISAE
ncbi:MAG: hypothetical protein WCW40_01150 [Bacteroidota bacterium]